MEAIKTTKGTFQQGYIDYTEPVDPNGRHVVANNYKCNIGGGQWRKGTKWPFEVVVCSNAAAPGRHGPVESPSRWSIARNRSERAN